MPPVVALYCITVWLLGTVFVIKACGRGLSFAYSALVGFVVCASLYVRMALRFPEEVPSFLLYFVNSVFLGTAGGTVVWCVALGAEAAFKRFVCR
jgi:hypothetical protein